MKFRNKFILVLCICLFACQLCGMVSAVDVSRDTKYVTADSEISYSEYMTISYGEELEKLGGVSYVYAESLGPKSFSIGNDGSVYILDTQKERIVKYSAAGEYLRSIEIPEGCYGLDFEIGSEKICLMCDDFHLYSLDMYGMNNNSEKNDWKDEGAYSITKLAALYMEGGAVFGRTWDGDDMKLSGQNGAVAEKTQMQMAGEYNVSLTKNGVKYEVEYVTDPIGTYIIKSAGGYTYILEQEALLDNYPFAETRVGKYNANGKVATALPISTKDYEYALPFKKLYVTENGDVYQMVPVENGIVIYSVPWFQGEKTRITEEMLARNASASEEANSVSANSYASRSTALSRAYNMIYYSWTYDAATMHTATGTYTKSPTYLTTSNSGSKLGIPYCWGGMNGIDTGTYSGSSYHRLTMANTVLPLSIDGMDI